MPEILHDGATSWAAFEQREGQEISDLLSFLFDYYRDEAANPHPIRGLNWWRENLEDVLYRDHEAPLAGNLRRAALRDMPRDTPAPRCVFVSHRQSDAQWARDLAHDILAEGFNVWLDIWDTNVTRIHSLALPQAAKDLLISLIIEMGLINSCAVTALMTPKAAGSAWIPYEYGRVRKGGPFAAMAVSCERDGPIRHEGYMSLGPRFVYSRGKGCYPGLSGWLRSL